MCGVSVPLYAVSLKYTLLCRYTLYTTPDGRAVAGVGSKVGRNRTKRTLAAHPCHLPLIDYNFPLSDRGPGNSKA